MQESQEYLVNFTSDLKRPIEYIAELRNIRVFLRGVRAESVKRLVEVRVGRDTEITLDRLRLPSSSDSRGFPERNMPLISSPSACGLGPSL